MLAWTLSLINLNNKLSSKTLHHLTLGDARADDVHREPVLFSPWPAKSPAKARLSRTATFRDMPGTRTSVDEVHWLRKLKILLVKASFASTSSSCSLKVRCMNNAIIFSGTCHGKIV